MSPRRVAIICQLDGFANGQRPVEVGRFLRERGHEVTFINTYYLNRASSEKGSLRNKLPGPGARLLALYAVEVASKLLTRRRGLGRRTLSYHVLMADHRLRRSVLAAKVPLDDFDLVVCATPYDAGVLTVPTSARTLYDCQTPWADELWFEGRLTERQHRRLRRIESRLFERMDHLTFSWETYADYVREHYGVPADNMVTMNWGCTPSPERARFASPPRIAYMGSLSSQFIDLPLLSPLSRLYPHIDVYGGPPPDPELGLNYKGYASPTVLREYQAGLITCTKDPLRSSGFSAKHLEYIACGLPVLAPAWRRRLDLFQGTVPYDEDTFRSAVDSLSSEAEWQRVSDMAYDQARRLDWHETLRPLDELLA
jgi:Glycosyltransferase Family 4